MAVRHAAKLRLSRSDRIHTQLRHAATLEQHDKPPLRSPAYRFRLRQPNAYTASRGERIYGWVDSAYRTTTPRPLSGNPTTTTGPLAGTPLPRTLSAWGVAAARRHLALARELLHTVDDYESSDFPSGTAKKCCHESYADLMDKYLHEQD